MARRSSVAPLAIATGYAVLGLTYIAWSDQALEALTAHNHPLYRALQTWKGWGYIVVTALLLWVVLRAAFQAIHRKMQDAQVAERRLRLALDAAGGIVWTAHRKDQSIEVTIAGSISSVLGFDQGSNLSLQTIRDRIHPADRELFDSLQNEEVSPDGTKPRVVCRLLSESGEYRWLKVVPENSGTEQTAASVPSTIGVALDVSEQVETTERLQDAIRGGELGVWRLNLKTNEVEVNEEWASMLGYDLAELSPLNLQAFHDLLHPEDCAQLKKTHDQAIAESRSEFSNELRMRHKAGHWVWVLSRGKATHFEESSGPVVLSGVHVDTSARKALERELISERDFLVSLTETSISGIFGLDAEGHVCFANAEAERILGASFSDLKLLPIGGTVWDAQSLTGHPIPLNDLPFQKVLKLGRAIKGMRLAIRRPDGSRCAISLNGAPVHAEGSPVRVVFSLTDITDELRGQKALERAAEDALHQALHDPLTGLPNREFFSRKLQEMTSIENKAARNFMLAFLDVDNFKLANDLRGHLAGDVLLIQIADRLCSALPSDAVLSRIGGDEFTVLMELSGGRSPQDALEPLTRAFATPFMLSGDQVWLTCSIGVSLNPQDAKLPEDMMRNADIAMYHAKGRGRSQIQVFSSELSQQIHREAEISQALRKALEEGGFRLVFQPRYSLAVGSRMVGAEVLLRSNNQLLCDAGPQEFIPIAERNGLMRQIDLQVARLLAKSIEYHRNKVHEGDFKFSLNISAESLKSDGFGSALIGQLGWLNSSQKLVLIEVTESAMMGMNSIVKNNVAAIREAGYDFSIDDFGTGYSSLSRLQDLPLEEVKIDRSFVARLGNHRNSSDMVVRAILALAKELGLRTVAEGVETRAQRAWLTGQGCDEAQGYHFDRPLEAEVFFSRIRRMNRSKRREIGVLPLRA